MWVKICANTNVDDALLAANLGADAVGFVFAPSTRQVTPEQVAVIMPHLPASVERIGVFTDSPPAQIAHAVETAGLSTVQMHGSTLSAIEQLTRLLPGVEIIPVVQWDLTTADPEARVRQEFEALARLGSFHRILVDAKLGSSSGGTGVSFDWNAAHPIFMEQQRRGTSLILAGGLRPENVQEAIEATGAWGVDVASGVESAPGRKDPARVQQFIRRAHGG